MTAGSPSKPILHLVIVTDHSAVRSAARRPYRNKIIKMKPDTGRVPIFLGPQVEMITYSQFKSLVNKGASRTRLLTRERFVATSNLKLKQIKYFTPFLNERT